MKNKINALMLAAMLFASAATACNDDNKKDGQASTAPRNSESSAPEKTEAIETQPDPLDPDRTEATKNYVEDNTDSTEAATEASSTEAVTEETTAEQSENGEINLSPDENTSDSQLINTAQKLFEEACTTSWNFHVGCPYSLDYDSFVQNGLGWQYYLITDESINSFDDVVADYNKIFSSSYPNDLNELYLEKDNKVYALDGERGANIYYVSSEIISVKERKDNEIVFIVENSYSGDDFSGDKPYTEQAEFSAVISENGSWRAGQFTLPF